MYWRMMAIGAPPHEQAKYDGDHNTPLKYWLRMAGLCLRNTRLETPLRLFTRVDTATFGGYSTRR